MNKIIDTFYKYYADLASVEMYFSHCCISVKYVPIVYQE